MRSGQGAGKWAPQLEQVRSEMLSLREYIEAMEERLSRKVQNLDLQLARLRPAEPPAACAAHAEGKIVELPHERSADSLASKDADAGLELEVRVPLSKASTMATSTSTPAAGRSGLPESCASVAATDSRLTKASSTLSFSELELAMDKAAVQHLQMSVWDTALFLGMQTVGTGGSVAVSLGLVMNMFAQCIFCMIISSNLLFVTDPHPGVADVERWRETYAHNLENMEWITESSLATRVCSDDGSLAISTAQQDMLREIEAYLELIGPLTSGVVLCLVAIANWALMMQKDLAEACDFLGALWKLPKGETHLVHAFAGRFDLKSISHRRLVLMIAVTVVRMAIVVTLGVSGCLWLANTKSTVELVLNATALKFVIEMDEVIFDTILPTPVKMLAHGLEPMKRPKGKSLRSCCGGLGLRPILTVLCCAPLTLVLLFQTVIPKKGEMEMAQAAACGGNREFVVALREATGEIVASRARALDRRSTTFQERAVRELVSMSDVGPTRLTLYAPALEKLMKHVEQTPESQAREWPCTDVGFTSGSPLAWNATLQEVAREPLAASCRDLSPYCTGVDHPSAFVRLACPVTCGCRSPLSGLFMNSLVGGCPRVNCLTTPEYQQVLRDTECRDPSPGALARMPGWLAFWSQSASIASSWHIKDAKTVAQRMSSLAGQYGCGVLSLNTEYIGYQASQLCLDDPTWGSSLAAFCPETCNCSSSKRQNCPPSCA